MQCFTSVTSPPGHVGACKLSKGFFFLLWRFIHPVKKKNQANHFVLLKVSRLLTLTFRPVLLCLIGPFVQKENEYVAVDVTKLLWFQAWLFQHLSYWQVYTTQSRQCQEREILVKLSVRWQNSLLMLLGLAFLSTISNVIVFGNSWVVYNVFMPGEFRVLHDDF